MSTEAVRAALAEIAERNGGRLTPDAVVKEARKPASPLHGYFTWDVKEAAAERWLDQARQLIRSVRVEVTTTQFSMRAPEYLRDPAAGREQGYISIRRLATDEDMAREAIVAEFSNAAAALSRAKAVAAALGLADQIEEVRSRVIALTEQVGERPSA